MLDKKLNVLLAVTDQLRSSYRKMISEYTKYFAKSQGAFRGERRTYTAKEGTIDDTTKRGNINVVTTVNEKFDYFIETNTQFIDALFAQEKTNASGTVKASLVVEGKNWGEFTSLELLRLKSLLESSDMGNMVDLLNNIPVRSDSEVWKKTKHEEYADREIYETELFQGVAKTTIKQPFILQDPNLSSDKLPANYQPAVVTRDNVIELGDYTKQNYSGEWTQRQKALALRRREILLSAVIEALKIANECPVEASDLTAKKIFGYLFYNEND